MSSDKAYYTSVEDTSKKDRKMSMTALEIEMASAKLRPEEPTTWMDGTAEMKLMETVTTGEAFDSLESPDNRRNYAFATNASWVVNWFLLGVKIYAVVISSSKAVTAAMVDSVVDILSQAILAMGEWYISKHSPDYPVGRSRLEALSVIACAFIMSMASVEVMQYAAVDIFNGFSGHLPKLDMPMVLYVIMSVGIVLKFFLWLYCLKLNMRMHSDTVTALAEDHLNDVVSNAAAMVTAAVAFHTPYWWMDPIGAVLISLVIIYRWVGIISEQVKKIVGHTAPPAYIEMVEQMALRHDERLSVDCTRVYHFGSRYNVEMEIVLPGDMTVRESHDIALALQHKIESLEDVERAFVHVDHEMRDGLEHKIERELVNSDRARAASLEGEPPLSPAGGVMNPIIMKNELRARAVGGNSSYHNGEANDNKI